MAVRYLHTERGEMLLTEAAEPLSIAADPRAPGLITLVPAEPAIVDALTGRTGVVT